jgi:DNA processing protein
MDNDLKYKYALLNMKGVGPIVARVLVEHFGSAKKLFEQSKSELEQIPGIGKTMLAQLCDKQRIEKTVREADIEIQQYQRSGIRVISFQEEHYPKLLNLCQDAPFILYQLGENITDEYKNLAVVGSRKATVYGKFATQSLIEQLTGTPTNIVSGLALGIDTVAHQTAMDNGLRTVAVLAHGLDVVYPQSNRKLAKDILKNEGTLLTEFPFGTKPDRENFPKRNRIVAGMSEATLITEAAAKGGALITANIAYSYGREVYAIPGRINDIQSAGCNRLIAHQRAIAIHHSEGLLQELGYDDIQSKNIQTQIPYEYSVEEAKIVKALEEFGDLSKQTLAIKLEMDMSKISGHLFNLELARKVASMPGNRFQLLGAINS